MPPRRRHVRSSSSARRLEAAKGCGGNRLPAGPNGPDRQILRRALPGNPAPRGASAGARAGAGLVQRPRFPIKKPWLELKAVTDRPVPGRWRKHSSAQEANQNSQRRGSCCAGPTAFLSHTPLPTGSQGSRPTGEGCREVGWKRWGRTISFVQMLYFLSKDK